MPSFQFADTPAVLHQVQAGPHAMRVDGADVRVRTAAPGCFVTAIDGRSERLYAVAHGDTLHVQLRGRAWRIERVDPRRAAAPPSSSAGAGAGASRAPMPGVVVSILVAKGQPVRQDEALLVIESMKLQMTISSSIDGAVVELPFGVGQTFQRGAVLVRVQAAGATP